MVPLIKFRGIMKSFLIFFYWTLGTKWNPFGLLLLDKNAGSFSRGIGGGWCTIGNFYASLALFGEGNVISIVLLKKCARERIFSLFVQFEFFFFFLLFCCYRVFSTSSLSIMFSGNRKQTEHQQAWIVPLKPMLVCWGLKVTNTDGKLGNKSAIQTF